MNDKLQGIVLSINDYRENDVLMQVLTKDYGVLSLIGKGVKKMTAHQHFMPFNCYEFIIDYKDNKTIFTPRNAHLIKSFFDSNHIEKMAYQSVLASLLIQNKEMMSENDYDHFELVLEQLDQNPYLLGSLLVSDLLRRSGVEPCVDGCVVCGNSEVIGISHSKGGFVCKNHSMETDIVDVLHLKRFRLLVKAGFEHYDLIKGNEFDRSDFSRLIEFYVENTGNRLKSYEFYMSL